MENKYILGREVIEESIGWSNLADFIKFCENMQNKWLQYKALGYKDIVLSFQYRDYDAYDQTIYLVINYIRPMTQLEIQQQESDIKRIAEEGKLKLLQIDLYKYILENTNDLDLEVIKEMSCNIGNLKLFKQGRFKIC